MTTETVVKTVLAFVTLVGGFSILARRTSDAADPVAPDPVPSDPRDRYDRMIRQAGKRYDVPWRWIKAVCVVESNLGRAPSVARGLAVPTDVQGSKSSDGKSWGLMQLTLTTADELWPGIKVEQLNNAEISIDLGSQYLGRLRKRFDGDEEKTIRAYNGGPGFATTVKGVRDTPIYYSKFRRALAEILARQPGDPLEKG